MRVEPKAMQVLVYLADRAGEVVAREEILRAIWDGSKVKALGADQRRLGAPEGAWRRSPRARVHPDGVTKGVSSRRPRRPNSAPRRNASPALVLASFPRAHGFRRSRPLQSGSGARARAVAVLVVKPPPEVGLGLRSSLGRFFPGLLAAEGCKVEEHPDGAQGLDSTPVGEVRAELVVAFAIEDVEPEPPTTSKSRLKLSLVENQGIRRTRTVRARARRGARRLRSRPAGAAVVVRQGRRSRRCGREQAFPVGFREAQSATGLTSRTTPPTSRHVSSPVSRTRRPRARSPGQ